MIRHVTDLRKRHVLIAWQRRGGQISTDPDVRRGVYNRRLP